MTLDKFVKWYRENKNLKFEIVTGDSIHRKNPGSRLVVNTSESWLVSDGERSSHKLKMAMDFMNAMPCIVDALEEARKIIELDADFEMSLGEESSKADEWLIKFFPEEWKQTKERWVEDSEG